jgi:dynein heavy chain
MRAVRAVLTAMQTQKRDFPDDDEEEMALRCIESVTLPRFVSDDVPLFRHILCDLFPKVQKPRDKRVTLRLAIAQVCKDMNLQPEVDLVDKTVQLYETTLVRHGLMLVGLPCSGKSTSLHILVQALCWLRDKGTLKHGVHLRTLAPKAETLESLFGHYSISGEWHDGVFGAIFREMALASNDDEQWIMCDGPVDATWVENLNTLLDDNKRLCLVSGQIIDMTPQMRQLFETRDLANASPATVSRCGMVYYADKPTLYWRLHLESWLKNLPSSYNLDDVLMLSNLFESAVGPLLSFVKTKCTTYAVAQELSLVQSFMFLLRTMLYARENAAYAESLAVCDRANELESAFLFACIWSIGGVVDQKGRELFNEFFR